MSQQYDLFDRVVEQHERTKKNDVITCENLIHSIVDCHKVEDAIWQRLNLETGTRTKDVHAALDRLGAPPAWCSVEAWERIATSMRGWATSCGTMQLY